MVLWCTNHGSSDQCWSYLTIVSSATSSICSNACSSISRVCAADKQNLARPSSNGTCNVMPPMRRQHSQSSCRSMCAASEGPKAKYQTLGGKTDTHRREADHNDRESALQTLARERADFRS